jgi:SAM-dependent methyltransferase
MHERRFNREIDRLRDPERVALLEVSKVVDLSLESLTACRSVLDVGTGTGLFAEAFAARGLTVAGLDANPEMLPAAQQFVPTGAFDEGIAEKLPYADKSFDMIFMGLILHETDDAQEALYEARRVSTQRLTVLEWRYEDDTFGPPIAHRLSPQRIRSMAEKAGFQSVESGELTHLVLYRLA